MSKSNLCRRIGVNESLERLSKDGFSEVTRLLQNDLSTLKINTTEPTIKSIFSQTYSLTNQQLESLQNSVDRLLFNEKYIEVHDQESVSQARKKKNANIDLLLFPFLQLPMDLVIKTCLFFDEKDVFEIEKSCRLLYKIMNDTSYLNQSKNFQLFTLSNHQLEKIISSQEYDYSFFKFCKANTLQFRCNTVVAQGYDEAAIDESIGKLRQIWDTVEKIATKQGWYQILFKSIKKLEINADSMFLLDKMPLEFLFNAQISRLESIEELNYYWSPQSVTGTDKFIQTINQFNEKYFNLKKKWDQQIQSKDKGPLPLPLSLSSLSSPIKVKKLKVVKYLNGGGYATMGALRHIETRHVWLNDMIIDLTKELNPSVKILTCQCSVGFAFDINNKNDGEHNHNYNIQTLRLMHFTKDSNCDICDSNTLIKGLNLHQSVKNLIVDIDLTWSGFNAHRNLEMWKNVIERILKKEKFQSLENIVVSLTIDMQGIDWIFQLLNKYEELLKYQFKQMIVAFTTMVSFERSVYHQFEINSGIKDVNTLLNENQRMCEKKYDNRRQYHDVNKDAYDNLISQWTE